MGAPECQFCAIIEGLAPADIVAEFDSAIAFFPKEPAAAGHTLVVPRKHVENFWSLDEATANSLMKATVDVSRSVVQSVRPNGLSIIQSNGKAATQSVPHLHIHVVPRWDGDELGPNWPESSPASAEALNETLSALKAQFKVRADPSRYDLTDGKDRDDRRKHLELIAAVVGRMGSSSAQAKGWSITLAGAAFGVAVLRDNAWPLIVLGIVGLVVFAKIDAHYLSVEKTFRDLHDAVTENKVVPLSMDTTHLPPRSTNQSYLSWSVKWFYGPLILAGVLLLVYSLWHPRESGDKTNVTVNIPGQSTAPVTVTTSTPRPQVPPSAVLTTSALNPPQRTTPTRPESPEAPTSRSGAPTLTSDGP